MVTLAHAVIVYARALLFASSSLFGSGNSPVPNCTASIGCFGLCSANCGSDFLRWDPSLSAADGRDNRDLCAVRYGRLKTARVADIFVADK